MMLAHKQWLLSTLEQAESRAPLTWNEARSTSNPLDQLAKAPHFILNLSGQMTQTNVVDITKQEVS
jgi:hypothetical protein